VSRFASADGSQLGTKFEFPSSESSSGTASSSSSLAGFGLELMTAAKAHDAQRAHGAQTFIPITASEGQSDSHS
jgi:hypothetical protein